MATASPTFSRSGSIAISTTMANNFLQLDDTVRAVTVYLDDATNNGTLSLGGSANPVALPKQTWLTIWQRTEGYTGLFKIYFASTTGTPNLQYITWG